MQDDDCIHDLTTQTCYICNKHQRRDEKITQLNKSLNKRPAFLFAKKQNTRASRLASNPNANPRAFEYNSVLFENDNNAFNKHVR